MKWDINEIGNQTVHFLVGYLFAMIISFIAVYFYGLRIFYEQLSILSVVVISASVIIAIIVELYQYFCPDKKDLKLPDRIRDGIFYVIGSIIFILSVKMVIL